MNVHQLAIFWRDRQARCFTSWHFRPAPGESATKRAAKMLALLPQLSTLQLYGAVLDEEPLRIEQTQPVSVNGTEQRLQVDLYPEKPLNPKAGINLLKFSIPGPVQELIDVVESKSYSHTYWQRLETEVFPYLCLPSGTKVKKSGQRLYRAEINYLDPGPQPHQPPLAAAITRTMEDLEVAKRSFQKLQTPHERQRVEKYQARLDSLYTWQHLEKGCFEQADNLPIIEPETAPVRPTTPTLDLALEQVAKLILASPRPTGTQVQPSHLIREGEEPEIIKSEKIELPHSYLPAPLSPEQATQWADVPPEHFTDSTRWLHRQLLKQTFSISERSYFRWMENLSQHGLTRSLPAATDAKVKLFYRKDVKRAVQHTQSDFAAVPHRGRRPKALAAAATVSQEPATLPPAAPSEPSTPIRELATLQTAIKEIQQRQQSLTDGQQSLSAALSRIEATLNSLQTQQTALAAQLTAQAHPPGLFELLAQFANFNQFQAQFGPALQKLNSRISRLPARLGLQAAKASATKIRPKSKTASKQKIRARSQARKARTKAKRQKGGPKSA